MKRWLKNCFIIVACLIPISFVVGFSNNWSKDSIITSAGSSGVKPFIEELSKQYIRQNKGTDITVDAGGSGFGIDQVANGYTNIGNASKDPYSSVNDSKNELLDKWKERRIKTITVAWEAICLVYVPPKNLPKNIDLNTVLSVSGNNIDNLYQAFSGYHGDDNSQPYYNSYPKLSDFVSINHLELKDYFNIKLTPFVRTGGSLTSGTAASFYDYSRYTTAHETISDEAKNAFEVGNYGSAWNMYQTDEANSRAWDMFVKSNIPGSVVYLSSGFIEKNMNLIKKNNYGIFAYTDVDSQGQEGDEYPYSIENFQNAHYDWCRPLNLMISLKYDWNKIKNFIVDFLLSKDLDEEWNNLGAATLTDAQISSMMSDDEWDISDTELNQDYYGADYYAI